jgi:hypothetical protein
MKNKKSISSLLVEIDHTISLLEEYRSAVIKSVITGELSLVKIKELVND